MMLRRLSALSGCTIQAIDGDIGSVQDVYFDDHWWVTRYLVIDTAYWLENPKALLSPFAITGIDWYHRKVLVELTRKRLESSAPMDIEVATWRRQEAAYLDYYGYPRYWTDSLPWGNLLAPFTRTPQAERAETGTAACDKQSRPPASRLRRGHAVCGAQIEAADGLIGHVIDLVQDELTWAVRYLVVDTYPWLPGRHVLVSTQWIEAVSWDLRALFIGLEREAIRQSPAWCEQDLLMHDDDQSLVECDGQPCGEAR